eukprot:CAMPEP_0182855624 /NCGR_PEP_ID=MMETSP0034_2-20130328/1960_1 /TAXON_ID=156128 /ORGANISM="Nephroselmis pyriformis, Strain CCMP717" /LENGTH=129 /DNA_ID=CAMNT_0024986619 /DNA_START=141 /DNA_END=530 /DNA_ORIENTATION=-
MASSAKPSEADKEMFEFINSLEDYVPTIPDELTDQYLARSGFSSPDVRLTRLVSLAAQRFVAEVVHDSMQICKRRKLAGTSKDKAGGAGGRKLVLTTEDLAEALEEYGVKMKPPPYFANNLSGPGGDNA